jgi:hypothetical protein
VQNPVVGLSQGKYVRVYGGFKGALADKPTELGQITAYSMRPIEDHNEVRRSHMLPLMDNHSGLLGQVAVDTLMTGQVAADMVQLLRPSLHMSRVHPSHYWSVKTVSWG